MLTYVGKGYSAAFTANFDRICERLTRGEDILLVDGPDDVCAPLLLEADPHCHEANVVERDRLALAASGELLSRPLSAGTRIDLDTAILARLRQAFKDGGSREACLSCEWHGLCTDIAGNDFSGIRLRAG
jgi:hypothetical protein